MPYSTMAAKNEFQLRVFGLSKAELRLVQVVSTLSRSQKSSRTYLLANAAAPDVADFAIVDGDDPQAVANWHVFESGNPMVPVVMVGGAPASELTEFRIGRPLLATRLHAVLTRMHVSKERPALALSKAHDTESTPPARYPPIGKQTPADTEAAVRRVLVVDDSLPIRRQMEQELCRFVGEVDLAEDGERAIGLLSSKSYDIVFLDVMLPGIDGYEICRRIKRNKKTKNTPVIMLTGKSSPFDRIRGKLAGCNTYLAKPMDQAKFDKVLKVLGK